MNDLKRQFWAGAKENGDFICIETYSGLGLCGQDPQGAQHLLSSGADADAVGTALRDALSRSRLLTLSEYGEFFDYQKSKQQYTTWIDALMTRYGYKTKRALFKNMKSCSVEVGEGVMTIRPSHHEKLEAWSGDGITEEDYVVIPVDSPPAEIGAALRLAFSRCT